MNLNSLYLRLLRATAVALFFLLMTSFINFSSIYEHLANDSKKRFAEIISIPSYDKIDGIEFLYELPPTSEKEFQGIVFLAHGCSHGAYDWWPKSEVCPHCIGLPEEREIVKAVLRHKFVALAVTSADRRSKCWSGEDIPRVKKVVELLQKTHKWDLDFFAFGASSGGGFVASLALEEGILKPKAVAPQIAAGMRGTPTKNHPPTMFIHMPRDERTARGVSENAKSLKKLNIPAAVTTCEQLPITKTFFSKRIKTMSEKLSEEIHQKFFDGGLLDSDFYLLDTPRRTGWRDLLKGLALDDTLVADQSPISEELNVAFARHEMCATQVESMLVFFADPYAFCAAREMKKFCENF